MRPPNHGGDPRIARNTSILKGLGPVFNEKIIFSMVLTSHGLVCGKSTLLGKMELGASKSLQSSLAWGPLHDFEGSWEGYLMISRNGVELKLLGSFLSMETLFPETRHLAPKPWGGEPHDFTENVDFEASRPTFPNKADFPQNSP